MSGLWEHRAGTPKPVGAKSEEAGLGRCGLGSDVLDTVICSKAQGGKKAWDV